MTELKANGTRPYGPEERAEGQRPEPAEWNMENDEMQFPIDNNGRAGGA